MTKLGLSPVVELVVEGHDGSAKTPMVEGIKSELQLAGRRVVVCAPFAEANSVLRTEGYKDIYELWISGEGEKVLRALSLLREISEKTRQGVIDTLGDGEATVIIFDRGWMTVLRGLDEVPAEVKSDIEDELSAELNYWLPPLPTIFGKTCVDLTKTCKRFDPNGLWTHNDEIMAVDYARRLELAEEHRTSIIFEYERASRHQDLSPLIGEAGRAIESLIVKNSL